MHAERPTDAFFRTIRLPQIRTRRTLIVSAVILQALILGAGWWWTFGLVRDATAGAVRDYILKQNAMLTEDIARRFPDDLPGMLEHGSSDWDKLQMLVEDIPELPAEAFACLIDADTGEIICHPDIRADPSLYGHKINFSIDDPLGAEPGRGVTLLEAPDDGTLTGQARVTPLETHYVATTRLGDSGYRLLVHQPRDKLFELGDQTTGVITLGAAAVGLGVIGLSGFAVRSVVRRYDSVFEAANEQLIEGLELAERMQRATLPSDLPRSPGIDIAGWSASAEQTGGDTYDVVGCCASDGARVIDNDNPDTIYLLLADATGHGVGPALSVTQLRAMFRIAIRSGLDLPEIAAQINEQLHADLPGGRFITAWIAEFDTRSHSLRSLALGHGPIMVYRAASAQVERLDSDSWPLGVSETLGLDEPVEVLLGVGDAVICVSDGLTEARSPSGAFWGNDRLERAVADTAGSSSDAILRAIRERVDHHLAGAPPEDDRTALILRLGAPGEKTDPVN